jgi:hypothetical protein
LGTRETSVARNDKRPLFTQTKVLDLLQQTLTEITPTKWRSAAERIRNVILDAWEREGLEEVKLEKLIMGLGQEEERR